MSFWRVWGWRVKTAGFNLLEVLLATLIFAISFAGIAAGWRYHELALRQYRNRNAARFLLQQEAERVMAHPYVNLEDAVGTSVHTLKRTIDGAVVAQEFAVESRVQENAGRTLKSLVVSVTFMERNQTQRLVVHSRVSRGQ